MSEKHSGELVLRHADGVTRTGPFRLTPTGLEVDGDPDFGAWADCGAFIQKAGAAVQWWVGDWLNYGERKWGESYTQAVEMTGMTPDALSNLKAVAARVQLPRRRGNCSFATHAAVAYLNPADADAILDRAEAEGLSSRQVRTLVRELKAPASPEEEDDEPASEAPSDTSTAEKCLKTAAAITRLLKQARDKLSELADSDFGERVVNASKGHTGCELAATGNTVRYGDLGPVRFGVREFTCAALDELLGFCGSLRTVFRREADRLPEPSANGRHEDPYAGDARD